VPRAGGDKARGEHDRADGHDRPQAQRDAGDDGDGENGSASGESDGVGEWSDENQLSSLELYEREQQPVSGAGEDADERAQSENCRQVRLRRIETPSFGAFQTTSTSPAGCSQR
jgi:hypothetical protein